MIPVHKRHALIDERATHKYGTQTKRDVLEKARSDGEQLHSGSRCSISWGIVKTGGGVLTVSAAAGEKAQWSGTSVFFLLFILFVFFKAMMQKAQRVSI